MLVTIAYVSTQFFSNLAIFCQLIVWSFRNFQNLYIIFLAKALAKKLE